MSRYELEGPEREANYLNGTPHLTWLLRCSDGRESAAAPRGRR